MDVTKIMDEKSESVGASSGLVIVVIFHHSGVGVALLVLTLVWEPVNYIRDVLGNVVHVLLEIGVILKVAALVKVGNVNEVPVWLPAATLVLDLIGECSALHEWIHFLAICDSLTGQSGEDLFCTL